MIDENICNELIYAISPYIDSNDISDARMRVVMVLSKYDIKKATTEIVEYQGDVNELIVKKFIIAKTARGLSQRTLREYKRSVLEILQRIGKSYAQVTADDVRIYLALRINRDKISKISANNERRNLSAFYTWLQKEEILLKNPMSKVEAIKETKSKKKAYDNMELEKIRYACQNEYERALIEVLISTWARVTEVSEMKIDDINGNKIIVHGKGDKYREVYLTAKAQLAIETYLKLRKDSSPYLFPKGTEMKDMFKSGLSPKELHKWWLNPDNVANEKRDPGSLEATVRNIGKRAGVSKVHPHRFRRTGATMALRAGMPLIEVSKLLGHESVGTTQIYLDIDNSQLEATHEKYVV